MTLSDKKLIIDCEDVFRMEHVKEFIKRCKKRFSSINDTMAQLIINEEAGADLI